MAKFSLHVIKNGEYDAKYSGNFTSKEELEKKYSELKEKYQAKETLAPTQGTGGAYGLFKSAAGTCKHGKKVDLQYAEVQSTFLCGPGLKQ